MKLPMPSPSLAIAALALSLAMGGVGYAAGSLPKNSVGTAQLKKSAVTAKKLKTGAVTSGKIRNGSVTGTKVAPNSLGGAQIDESSLTVPLKPGSILLTGYDFSPRVSSYDYSTTGDGAISTSAVAASFSAPVDVPAGSTVTGIKVFVLDNGPSSIDAFVGRFVPSTGVHDYTGATSSTGTASFVRTVNLTPLPVVAGSAQSITVYLPAGSGAYRLHGAQIDYQ